MAVDEAAAAGTGGVSDLLKEGMAVGSFGREAAVEGEGCGRQRGQHHSIFTECVYCASPSHTMYQDRTASLK